MLKAKDEGVTPEQLISDIYELHKSTLANFNIDLENFHSTHSSENEELTSSIFNKAVEKNIIFKETIQQLYDEQEGFSWRIDLLKVNAQLVEHLINMVMPVKNAVALMML